MEARRRSPLTKQEYPELHRSVRRHKAVRSVQAQVCTSSRMRGNTYLSSNIRDAPQPFVRRWISCCPPPGQPPAQSLPVAVGRCLDHRERFPDNARSPQRQSPRSNQMDIYNSTGNGMNCTSDARPARAPFGVSCPDILRAPAVIPW